jgi:hypothetical protein
MVTKILAPTVGIFRDVLQVETNLRIPDCHIEPDFSSRQSLAGTEKGFLPSCSWALDVVVPSAVATISRQQPQRTSYRFMDGSLLFRLHDYWQLQE